MFTQPGTLSSTVGDEVDGQAAGQQGTYKKTDPQDDNAGQTQ